MCPSTIPFDGRFTFRPQSANSTGPPLPDEEYLLHGTWNVAQCTISIKLEKEFAPAPAAPPMASAAQSSCESSESADATLKKKEEAQARQAQWELRNSFIGQKYFIQWSPKSGLKIHADDRGRPQGSLILSVSLDLNDLIDIPQVDGCPIARQSVESLALVFRFLTAGDIIQAYRCNKLLSAAASHPFTYRSEIEIGVDVNIDHCRTYAKGPSAVFASPKALKSAFEGKVFRHFRIVSLRTNPSASSAASFQDWFDCFSLPTTPHLRSLTIDLPQANERLLDSNSLPFSNAEPSFLTQDCFSYLTLLHVTGRHDLLSWVVQSLPVSVEILHLTLSMSHDVDVVLKELVKKLSDQQLGPHSDATIAQSSTISQSLATRPSQSHRLTQLHTFVMDQVYRNDKTTTRECIELLVQLDSMDQIDRIHWRIPLPIVWLDVPNVKPIEKVSFLSINELGFFVHPSMADRFAKPLHNLAPFIRVDSLRLDQPSMADPPRYSTIQPNQVAPTRRQMMPSWPNKNITKQLKSLCIHMDGRPHWSADNGQLIVDFITSGEMEQLESLALQFTNLGFREMAVVGIYEMFTIQCRELFTSMPNLTELTLQGCRVGDLSAFRLLPKLKSLHSFHWPPMTKDELMSLSHFWPSLTSLHVSYSSSSSPAPFREFLQSLPHLSQLRWRRQPAIHPSKIEIAEESIKLSIPPPPSSSSSSSPVVKAVSNSDVDSDESDSLEFGHHRIAKRGRVAPNESLEDSIDTNEDKTNEIKSSLSSSPFVFEPNQTGSSLTNPLASTFSFTSLPPPPSSSLSFSLSSSDSTASSPFTFSSSSFSHSDATLDPFETLAAEAAKINLSEGPISQSTASSSTSSSSSFSSPFTFGSSNPSDSTSSPSFVPSTSTIGKGVGGGFKSKNSKKPHQDGNPNPSRLRSSRCTWLLGHN